jgi:hypothetical protein
MSETTYDSILKNYFKGTNCLHIVTMKKEVVTSPRMKLEVFTVMKIQVIIWVVTWCSDVQYQCFRGPCYPEDGDSKIL